jgi:hypothetical protein
MRTTVMVLLLAAAIFMTFWIARRASVADIETPPGQYQIDAARWQWPATERTAAYGPTKDMGANTVLFTDGNDTKARCATDPGSCSS